MKKIILLVLVSLMIVGCSYIPSTGKIVVRIDGDNLMMNGVSVDGPIFLVEGKNIFSTVISIGTLNEDEDPNNYPIGGEMKRVSPSRNGKLGWYPKGR